MENLTWNKICDIEPRLKHLEELIQLGKYRDINEAWYLVFKQIFIKLAGNHAEDDRIGTDEAYDIAYHHLYATVEKRIR